MGQTTREENKANGGDTTRRDFFRKVIANQLTYSLSKDMYSATERDKHAAYFLLVEARIVD